MFRRIKAMLSFERLREERCSEGVFMNLLRCLDWKDIVLFNLKSIRESILWAWDDYRYDVDKDTFLALNGVYRPIIENCNLPFYELSMSNEWPGKKLKIPKSCHDANSILKELCDTIYPDEPFRSILFHKAYNAAMKIYKADELSEDDMTSPLTGKFYKVSFVGVEIRLETGAFSLRIPVPESDSEFIEDLKKRIKHINQEFY